GQAYERAGRTADAAEVFKAALATGDAPEAHRGLGMALARLERYDEALPHLRAAHGGGKTGDPLLTAYLALATARATVPTTAARLTAVASALRLLAAAPARPDAEWARLAMGVFDAARAAGVPLSKDQLLKL